MTAIQRFTPLQRLLHWVVAVCILAMLFIGVGMVSSVEPKYLTLVSIHKPLGMAILVLALIRLVVRLRYGAPPLPADLPEPMKLAAYLSHYALYALMIAMPLIGWGMLSAAAYPVKLWDGVYLPADPAAERQPAHGPLECAFLPGVSLLRPDPHAHRRGALPCARPAGRSLRIHGAGACPRRGCASGVSALPPTDGLARAAFSRQHSRHCERSEAIQGNVGSLTLPGSPRRFAPRDDDYF